MNTWRVRYWRAGDRWPVSRYIYPYKTNAEKQARKTAAELAETGIKAQVAERVDGEWVER